jgi:hypothetical protein
MSRSAPALKWLDVSFEFGSRNAESGNSKVFVYEKLLLYQV